MPLVLNKRFLWVIVIWFAVLQAISPFIHAHIEADSPTQSHGLHLHVQNLMQVQDNEHAHTFKNANHSIHTIGVNKVFVRNLEFLPSPLFAVLFIIGLFVITIRIVKTNLIIRPLSPLHLRSLSGPRAPPLF